MEMSEATKETSTNDVAQSEEQQVDAATTVSGKESKDTTSDAAPIDTENVQAQSEQCSTATTVDINTLTPSTPSQTPPQLLAAEASATPTATSSGTVAAAAIPENILSPPKSETQTDETNTATSTSCSPASEGQRSPTGEADQQQQQQQQKQKQQPQPTLAPKEEATPKLELELELDKATAVVNGTIPKSGKPLVTALNKKLNKSANTSPRASRARKPKALPMYESEISDNKVGIKLCIKKSDAAAGSSELPVGAAPAPRPPAPAKPARKRVRKPKQQQDSDESEYEPRKKKGGGGSNNGERQKRTSTNASAQQAAEADSEPVEQSAWGHKLPEEVLFRVSQQNSRYPVDSMVIFSMNCYRFLNM